MKFKVAAVQMTSKIGDHQANVETAEKLIRKAAAEGAKIVVLPELALDEFFAKEKDNKFFEYAQTDDGPDVCEFQKLAKELGIYIALPIFERGTVGNCYNAVILISDKGETAGKYRKNHIPFSLTYEKYYFTPGDGFPVFDTPYGTVGMVICYDRRYPESIRELVKKGAEIILIPVASWMFKDSPQSELPFWSAELRTRALENQSYVVAANKSGWEDNIGFFGHSMITGPGGEVLIELDDRENTVAVAEIDMEVLRNMRSTRHLFRDYRSELYT